MNPATVWDCTESQYNQDNRFVRATALKHALSSPAEYKARYVDTPPTLTDEASSAMLLGQIVHCLVFEPDEFERRYAVRPPGCDGRKAKGTPERDAYDRYVLSAMSKIDIGRAVREPEELMRKAYAMRDAVLTEPDVADLISRGVKERALTWTDDETLLECKLRCDVFLERPGMEHDLILDLKTSADPTPEEWARGGAFCPLRKFHYDLQGAHYVDGYRRYTGKPCNFGFIVVGNKVPDVFLYEMDPEWIAIGECKRRTALRNVAHGMKTGQWRRPDQGKIITLVPTQWDRPQAT